ncbi:transcriptional regulatory protein OmpR [Roseibium sp. TrichSKD4]|uniref:response regulator n=1 Tax=Roseibium sp. TrichSKD4 TaxID=744980 RepID=UPI0001E571AD|nr:response regulator transcription factor [Roseibium sp. TrichSKD4]EFO28756.1 transcriptional regulatory protein OmpR [Roseibium sp. TrichSKD4]
MVRPRIGIVDDEIGMRDALSALLTENEFDPVPMECISDFNVVRKSVKLDLVIIDLQLRNESGLELAKAIRKTEDLPIVMLTGQGDETDQIVGLETGADDYLLKPFNPRELVARIKAVLRRYQPNQHNAVSADDTAGRISFGRMMVDQQDRALYGPDGEEIVLTNAEFRLLEYFLARPNKVISRLDLLTELGSDLTKYVDRTVDVLILRLRRKIEENPSKPIHLQTRRGQGYIFVLQASAIEP